VRRLWDEIDLHIVAMPLPIAPVLFVSWWSAAVGLPGCLAVNELLVFAVVGILGGLRVAVRSLFP
jgi:hypothetical protein